MFKKSNFLGNERIDLTSYRLLGYVQVTNHINAVIWLYMFSGYFNRGLHSKLFNEESFVNAILNSLSIFVYCFFLTNS